MRAGHPALEVRDGIERSELDVLARVHPELHAIARWDLDHCPEAVTFHSLRCEGRLVSYLLCWRENPKHPVVHWIGAPAGRKLLVDYLPDPPYTAVVSPALFRRVEWPRRSTHHIEDLWFRPRTRRLASQATVLPPEYRLRRLTGEDGKLIERFVQTHPNLPDHSRIDPSDLPHAAVHAVVKTRVGRSEIVAVARTGPMLPDIWMVGGVFTDPRHRRRGFGKAVTLGLTLDAKRSGADVGLYVRPENLPATRAYRAVGFRRTLSRVFVETLPED